MNRFKRIICAFLAALISFTLLAGIAPMSSDASSLTEEIVDDELVSDGLIDDAAKKKMDLIYQHIIYF